LERATSGLVEDKLLSQFGGSSRDQAWVESLIGAALIGDDREDVLLADDEELLLVDLELGPRVLGVENLLADFDVDRLALSLIVEGARADGEDLALLGLLLGGIGQ